MAGAFLFGDRLWLDSLPFSGLRCGDVLVYLRENYDGVEEDIVHRVVKVSPEGIVVQGDNNPRPDRTLVTDVNYVGRVSHIERAGRIIRVRGGFLGLFRALITRGNRSAWHMMDILVRLLGRGAYAWLRNTGLVAKAWHPPIEKVYLMTDNGPLVKYVCRNRTVARYWPESGHFKCCKPYDLVISRKIVAKDSLC